MKKLMIVAAVAAMIGSVEAAGYSFQATLRTTQARAGVNTAELVNLGVDPATGAFWYDDPVVAGFQAGFGGAHMTTKTLPSGTVVPVFVKDARSVATIIAATVTAAEAAEPGTGRVAGEAIVNAIKELGARYSALSAGVYCERVYVTNFANCYRVAGSRIITSVFNPDACCTPGNQYTGKGAFAADRLLYNTNWSSTGDLAAATPARRLFDEPLLQRFGSFNNAQANKVEIYAPVMVADFRGYLAGQGTTRAITPAPVVQAITGNIVGTLAAPWCTSCCEPGSASVAFDCANGPIAAVLPRTAAYGTFRMVYNAAL